MALISLCSVDGCGKPKKARGLCAMHDWRRRNHGSPFLLKPVAPLATKCAAADCSSSPERGRKGMCARHYRMVYRRGTTVAAIAPRGEAEAWLRSHIGHDDDACLPWPYCRGRCGDARMGKRFVVGGRATAQAARAMCALAHGDSPFPDAQAAHSCGNGHRGCVNPRHLSWKTPLQNTLDKNAHGTMLRGARHPAAKLSDLEARAIRVLADSFSVPDLVDLFRSTPRTICDIIDGKGWQWPA